MKEELNGALKRQFDLKSIPVNSESLETAADNLLTFFKLLMETDRKAGFQILNDDSHSLQVDDIEYLFT